MYKFILKSIFILTFIFICGCEPVEKVENIVKRQPYVPFYTQMLLKGDVEEVLDSTYKEFITTERYVFDEDHNVIHYYLNEGVDEDDFWGMRAAPFDLMFESYAFYICPHTWQEKRDTVMSGYVERDGVHKKIEHIWDETGRFTDMRFYVDGVPVSYDGTYNIAELMYDENGYPSCRFQFRKDLEVMYRCEFSEFDHIGNPLKITVYAPDEEFVICRNIKYRN